MKALRLYGKNDIRLVETPIPDITEDEILLKTDAAAICGTDIRMWRNGAAGADEKHPLTLGHELSGTVEKIGKNVAFYKKGMQLAMQPNIGCGICDMCVNGKPHLCAEYKAFGINMDGAFAEYVRIPSKAIQQGNMMVLPKGVTPVEAAVTEPLSCAYNGFTKCNVKPGDFALVVGAGPIGVMHAKLLHMAGAVVFMNDLSEERLEACKNLMPYITIYHGNELEDFIKVHTFGRGLDVAVTACPVPQVQTDMLPLMAYGGRVIFFGGIPEDKQPVAINTNLIHYKELYITGSTRSSIGQFRKVLEFVSQGIIEVKSIVTHTYSLEQAVKGFENAGCAKGIKHVVVFK